MKLFITLLCVLVCLALVTDAERRRPNRGQRGRQRINRRRRSTTISPAVRTGSGRCEEIYLPMCRGLIPYSRTLLPNQFGHTTQDQIYRALEYLWPFMDIGCSRNFRVTACGYYLPKCPGSSGNVGLKPCRETCRKARRCRGRMTELQSSWPAAFNCQSLLPKKSKKCIPFVTERPRCRTQHITCEPNQHELCRGLNIPKGSIPNMFLQCTRHDIHAELDQYRALIESGCSDHIAFLLCGIYQPYCTRPEHPFALPCQEICEQVKNDCQATYSRLYGGLWWPGKFQCHRYPRMNDRNRLCVMPSDTTVPLPDDEDTENGDT